jgi:hypothetical protein
MNSSSLGGPTYRCLLINLLQEGTCGAGGVRQAMPALASSHGSFPSELSRFLVIPECDKLDVTDVVRIGPFQKL